MLKSILKHKFNGASILYVLIEHANDISKRTPWEIFLNMSDFLYTMEKGQTLS